eukprot:gene12905-15159_t
MKKQFTLVEATITNKGARPVKNIILSSKGLSLRHLGSPSIWGVEQEGDLSLPPGIGPLKCNQTYTFGYIQNGDKPATLSLKYVELV